MGHTPITSFKRVSRDHSVFINVLQTTLIIYTRSGHSYKTSTPQRSLIATLVRFGFVELEELQAAASVKELDRPVHDEYVSVAFTNMTK